MTLTRTPTAIDAVRGWLARTALVAVVGLLLAGNMAGPAATLVPMLATEESAESESSESSDETQETLLTLADGAACGVRSIDGPRRAVGVASPLAIQAARRSDRTTLSSLGVRQHLNGCGAILRC